MARKYQVTFESTLISDPQDLVQITANTGIVRILRHWLGAAKNDLGTAGVPTSQLLQISSARLPEVVTNGSGGSVALVEKK